MAKYRKKPVVIEAFEWRGHRVTTEDEEWLIEAVREGVISFVKPSPFSVNMKIQTLGGIMTANIGDFIIKGIAGEIYPCKPDIFEATYEKVEEE